jgi:hypothetical protein
MLIHSPRTRADYIMYRRIQGALKIRTFRFLKKSDPEAVQYEYI